MNAPQALTIRLLVRKWARENLGRLLPAVPVRVLDRIAARGPGWAAETLLTLFPEVEYFPEVFEAANLDFWLEILAMHSETHARWLAENRDFVYNLVDELKTRR